MIAIFLKSGCMLHVFFFSFMFQIYCQHFKRPNKIFHLFVSPFRGVILLAILGMSNYFDFAQSKPLVENKITIFLKWVLRPLATSISNTSFAASRAL